MLITTDEKRKEFARLHQSGCFVLPNPWDVGTARYLQWAGFSALATTSAGFAFTRGKPDSYQLTQSALTLEETLAHIQEIVTATDLPVNADFENGFAADGAELARNVRRCAATGVAGLSIEDNAGGKLYPFDVAVERVRIASQALEGSGVLLVARTEGRLLGCADMAETLARLQAFAEAGADCLYAPDLTTEDEVRSVVQACAPKPVNVLVYAPMFTVAQLQGLGVRRISLGGALARAAWGGVMRVAQEILQTGTFEELGQAPKMSEMSKFLKS